MKALTAILLLITMTVNAQYKPDWFGCSMMFVSGGCKATTDVLRSDYTAFQKAFPKANPQFWNYNLSWVNKYKNGNPADGERFWQSTGVFVPLTDGFHLVEVPRKFAPIIGLTFKIGKKQPLRYYLYDALCYSVSYGVGFNFMWKVVYKKS